MEIKVNKLYKGCIDIRDHIVRKCIENNEECIIKHGNQKMTLTPQDLKTKKVSESKNTFKSEYGTPPYKLYQYEWAPPEIDY